MLPRFEKETCVGEVRSSRWPVGMTVSMGWKCWAGSWAWAGWTACNDVGGGTEGASWTTMAGRLGVLRMLVGVEGAFTGAGSVLAVELEDAKAESRRTSSSVSSVGLIAVLVRGAGDVLGRLTLLSHPRCCRCEVVVVAAVVVVVVVVVVGVGVGVGVDGAAPGVRTASSLMVQEASGNSHRGFPESVSSRQMAECRAGDGWVCGVAAPSTAAKQSYN